MEKRLRKRADDDRHAHRPAPGAVVPPLDVARAKPVLGRAAVALVAVQVPEPVPLVREASAQAVDRLDEMPSVPRLDLRLAAEGLHSCEPGRDGRGEEHVRATAARDPEARGPAVARVAAAAREDRGGDDGERAEPHAIAFERTAPGANARTSPRCFPTQAAPPGATLVRLSTRREAPTGAVRAPASSCAKTR